ncbi:relaxase/mobilization nuclease domain-containing protein [Bacillus thuringiensis]|uniref:relaxase/mobilization nuclease domain-containing protein n=1 Tax=Bacillus cereus group TaxID=86661 RepID=UPI000A3CD0C3|nr:MULTISPECIES: relaxase/mobilization nuclease domain-containing protein [Bacillus cereus group]MDA2526099.1 relaxase/mobilization nuclease domain-containing protein [Bacillus cereus]OTX16521.1 protein rlx [Bacillus thuringiensis serovar seoulensis]MEC3597008.1 relaxase/mobilization nuclease domain-containing protein [Bacillus thuringiensis]MED1837110.1 relaxase/mobilization nuclease domain-containing protein [Bacillus thuringiensis]MED2670941.1 relaxase/mobilization nuclease domain-containin
MATTKLGNTKQASRAINYAEKKATVKSGHNCDVDYAKTSFKELRMLYGKNDGVQAHTIIQSFRPGEVTPEQANELGLELARAVAKDHQVAIYTHTDKKHIHNHIVINSVNIETGNKYQSNAEQRHFVKSENDRICLENGLEVTERKAEIRYTQAEQGLEEKGKNSWKMELRRAINYIKERTGDFKGFSEALEELGVKVKMRGQTLSYKHPEVSRWVRGKTLGDDFTKEGIESEFSRQIQERNDERKSITTSRIDDGDITEQFERTKQKINRAKQNGNRVNESINRTNDKPTKVDGTNVEQNRSIREKQQQQDKNREEIRRKRQREEARRRYFQGFER